MRIVFIDHLSQLKKSRAVTKLAKRRKEKASGRALREFSDSSQLVGTAALQDGGEGGLEDFSDPSELI